MAKRTGPPPDHRGDPQAGSPQRRKARGPAARREADQLKDDVLVHEQAARAEAQRSAAEAAAWRKRYEEVMQTAGQLLHERNAQMQLASIVESSGDAIVSTTLDGIILNWNMGAERLYGYRAAEMIGQPVSLLLPPAQLEETARMLARLGQGERVEYAETVQRKQDGTPVAVSLTLSPVKNAAGQIIGASLIARDITARKQAEEALREAERKFRSVAQAAGDAIIVAESTGTITFWNQAAARCFGYEEAEILSQPLTRLMPPRYREAHRRGLEQLRATGESHLIGKVVELTGLTKDGREFPLELSLAKWQTGEGIFYTGIVRDITERKQAEEELTRRAAELERLNAELQQFSYVVSHDLQEPLRTITSYVQLLARHAGDKLEAEDQEFMGFVVEGAQRMQQLITDLLAYTRVDGTARECTAVDCEALLGRVLSDLQVVITESAAEVTSDALPTVRGDAGQLGLVFQNLIGNALKFRGTVPPRIHVVARREGAQWVFSVRDNGIGLDPQHAERIFQLFQRLHTRREYPGTGMGLAICKKIVERHGGRIWVESQRGQGATFLFTISDKHEKTSMTRSTATSPAGSSLYA